MKIVSKINFQALLMVVLGLATILMDHPPVS